jgi:hypothetical protein
MHRVSDASTIVSCSKNCSDLKGNSNIKQNHLGIYVIKQTTTNASLYMNRTVLKMMSSRNPDQQKHFFQINLQQITPITTKLLKEPVLHTRIKTHRAKENRKNKIK